MATPYPDYSRESEKEYLDLEIANLKRHLDALEKRQKEVQEDS